MAWSPASSGTTNGLSDVASSATTTVAVGGVGTIVASADLRSWSIVELGTHGFTGIASSGQRFAAVGGDGAIATSNDGFSWTARYSPKRYVLWDVAWTGRTWIGVGSFGTVILSP